MNSINQNSGNIPTSFGSQNPEVNPDIINMSQAELEWSPQIKKDWLEANFKNLTIESYPDGKHAAYLDDIYLFDVEPLNEEQQKGYDEGKRSGKDLGLLRVRARAIPLGAEGDTEEESIVALFNYVAEAAWNKKELYVPQIKEGQSPEIFQFGRFYPLIFSYDKVHSHTNLDIIDFLMIRVLPDNMRVLRVDFEDDHGHFLYEK